MSASETLANVGGGGSICSITPAWYSGVCTSATTSPTSSPTAAQAVRNARWRSTSPA